MPRKKPAPLKSPKTPKVPLKVKPYWEAQNPQYWFFGWGFLAGALLAGSVTLLCLTPAPDCVEGDRLDLARELCDTMVESAVAQSCRGMDAKTFEGCTQYVKPQAQAYCRELMGLEQLEKQAESCS